MNFLRYIKLICCFISLLIGGQVFAQSGSNPFEMQFRKDKKNLAKGIEITPADNSSTNPSLDNPFNVIRTPQKITPKVAIEETPKPKVETTQKTEVVQNDKNFRFWLTMGMLIFLAIISTIYNSYLVRSYRAFSNENVMRMLQRELGTASFLPYYFLYTMFFLNAGVFIYLLMTYYGAMAEMSYLTLAFYSVVGMVALLLLKHLVISILGVVFPIEKETSLYNLTITIFGIVTSLVLFVSNIFLMYVPENLIPIVIYITLGLLGIIYLFRTVRGISVASKFLNHNKFQFFIYLCTVELAPILILWKMATSGIGIQ